MKKLVLAVLAVAALATGTAASASACDRNHHGAGLFEKLRGTGSGFATGTANATGTISGNRLDSGGFTAALATDWSQAQANDHGGSCAPSTGTLSLGDSTGDTLGASLTGVTCTVGSSSWNVAAVFFGRAKVTSATGSLSNVTGSHGRVLLVEKTDGTVKGFAFAGFKGWHERALAAYSKGDARHCGWR